MHVISIAFGTVSNAINMCSLFVLLGEGLQKVSNDIKSELEKVSKNIGSNTNKYTNIADNYLAEYGPYRFYLGIGVCSILLLVSFFLF